MELSPEGLRWGKFAGGRKTWGVRCWVSGYTLPTRTVRRVFPTANNPGTITYGAASAAADWASAKVRLGWLIEIILAENEEHFCNGGSLAERMRAFEAALFMIGYDVRCLGRQQIPPTNGVTVKLLAAAADAHGRMMQKTRPLSGRGREISYCGDLERGFSIYWGNTKFELSPECIQEICGEFAKKKSVPLDANMEGPTNKKSLGYWLHENGWPAGRYTSAIAAVLSEANVLSHRRQGNAIFLDFCTEAFDEQE